jgi:hypothetical protein
MGCRTFDTILCLSGESSSETRSTGWEFVHPSPFTHNVCRVGCKWSRCGGDVHGQVFDRADQTERKPPTSSPFFSYFFFHAFYICELSVVVSILRRLIVRTTVKSLIITHEIPNELFGFARLYSSYNRCRNHAILNVFHCYMLMVILHNTEVKWVNEVWT